MKISQSRFQFEEQALPWRKKNGSLRCRSANSSVAVLSLSETWAVRLPLHSPHEFSCSGLVSLFIRSISIIWPFSVWTCLFWSLVHMAQCASMMIVFEFFSFSFVLFLWGGDDKMTRCPALTLEKPKFGWSVFVLKVDRLSVTCLSAATSAVMMGLFPTQPRCIYSSFGTN